jgi:hypothetical protein
MKSSRVQVGESKKPSRLQTYLPFAISILWFALFTLAMRTPSLWKILGVSQGSSTFMDLRAVLVAGNCTNRNSLAAIAGSCDPSGPLLGYPMWVAKLVGLLHLSSSRTDQLGWINAEFLAISIGVLVYWSKRQTFWIVLVAFSPPIFFLGERGNIDSVVLFFVMIFVWLASNGRMWPATFVPPLMGAFKIYPLAMIASLREKKYFFTSFLIFVATLPMLLGDTKLVMHSQSHARVTSYGDILLLGGNTHQYFAPGQLSARKTATLALITCLIWLAGFLLLRGIDKRGMAGFLKKIDADPLAYYLFSSGVLIYLFSYLGVSMSDYKLWTLLLVITAASRTHLPGAGAVIKISLVVLIEIGVWCSRLIPDWVVWIGDITLFVLSMLLAACVLETARMRFRDYLGRRRL